MNCFERLIVFFLFTFMQHAAAAIGNKMIVVGGESGSGLLDDVQVKSVGTNQRLIVSGQRD